MDGFGGFGGSNQKIRFFFFKKHKGAVAQFKKNKNPLFCGIRRIRQIRPIVLPPGFYAFLFLTGSIAGAQTIEGRIDGYFAGPAAIHAGAGFTVPMGTYVRSGIDGGIGSSKDGISGRVDGFARSRSPAGTVERTPAGPSVICGDRRRLRLARVERDGVTAEGREASSWLRDGVVLGAVPQPVTGADPVGAK